MFTELKASVLTLQKDYQKIPAPESIRERLFLAYRRETIDQVALIINEATEISLIAELKDFLAENWRLINGTVLCYTALPDDELTHLLCQISEFVATNQSSSISALSILMPTVSLTSLSEDYPDLDKQPLKKVLKTHILSEASSYLIPVKQLTELVSSLSDQWFNLYYDYEIHSEDMTRLNESEFHRLTMHSQDTEMLINTQKQYDSVINDSLYIQLRQLQRSLCWNSVQMFGQETQAGNGAYGAIIHFNDYYDSLSGIIKNRIPADVSKVITEILELSSLPDKNRNTANHENIATCIDTLQKNLDTVINQYIVELAQIGLSDDERVKTIQACALQLDTCKNNLRNALLQATYQGRDPLVLNLTLLQKFNIEVAINSEQDWQDFLSLAPEEIISLGNDLLIKQKITEKFATLEELVEFILLNPLPKVQAILEIVGHELAVKLIHSTDDVPSLLSFLNKEQCHIVCQSVKERSFELLESVQDFRVARNYLNPDQKLEFYESVKEKLFSLIVSSEDFSLALLLLYPEQRTEIYDKIKTNIPNLITTITKFNNIAQLLNLEQRTEIYKAVKDKPNFFGTIDCFQDALYCLLTLGLLNPEQRTDAYEKIKDNLPNLIRTIKHFILIVQFLDLEQRTEIYEAVKEKLVGLIRKTSDFNLIVRHLNPEQRTEVYEAIKDNLPNLIRTIKHFNLIVQFLNLEQRIEIYEAFKEKLDGLLSASDFNSSLRYLNPAQRTEFYERFQHEFPRFIGNAFMSARGYPTQDPLAAILEHLNPGQCRMTCKALEPSVMKHYGRSQFENLLRQLELEKIFIVCDVFKIPLTTSSNAKFNRIIPSFLQNQPLFSTLDNFEDLFSELTAKYALTVCYALRQKLNSLTGKQHWIDSVFFCVKPEDRAGVYEAIQTNFSWFIKTRTDFAGLVESSSSDETHLISDEKEQEICGFLRDISDYNELFSAISAEKILALTGLIRKHLLPRLKTASDWGELFEDLSVDRQELITCSILREELQAGIPTVSERDEVLRFLNPEASANFCKLGDLGFFKESPKQSGVNDKYSTHSYC